MKLLHKILDVTIHLNNPLFLLFRSLNDECSSVSPICSGPISLLLALSNHSLVKAALPETIVQSAISLIIAATSWSTKTELIFVARAKRKVRHNEGYGSGRVVKSSIGETWCVANAEVGKEKLQAALDYACGEGGEDCEKTQPGSDCYDPDTIEAHASYAFNSYYQKKGRVSGTCSFQDVAYVVSQSPSDAQCFGCCFGLGDAQCFGCCFGRRGESNAA